MEQSRTTEAPPLDDGVWCERSGLLSGKKVTCELTGLTSTNKTKHTGCYPVRDAMQRRANYSLQQEQQQPPLCRLSALSLRCLTRALLTAL